MKRFRDGITLVETVVALVIAVVVIGGGAAAIRFYTRPAQQNDVTLDQLAELQISAEGLTRDLRQARQIIYPSPGDPTSRLLYYRDFEGGLCAYYFDTGARRLGRVRFSLSGVATEDRRGKSADLDGAYFSVNANGLVSWGLIAGERVLLGSVRRVNQ